VPRRDLERSLPLTSDPDRQLPAAHRPGINSDLRDRIKASFVGKRFPTESEPKDFNRLLQALESMVGRATKRLALLHQPAGANAELGTPFGIDIER
jgi:hypothetical protein